MNLHERKQHSIHFGKINFLENRSEKIKICILIIRYTISKTKYFNLGSTLPFNLFIYIFFSVVVYFPLEDTSKQINVYVREE
jgi:hypothetical protein